MNPPFRRGTCPGLAAPMATGDGLLARLTPDGSTIALEGFAGLCAAARRHGNGIVEITSRGSIQFRGLSVRSAETFADEIASLGIAGSDGMVAVIGNPLAGLDMGDGFDTQQLAAEVRRSLTYLSSRLSAKISVVVDGGGALHLDALSADIRLRTVGRSTAHVALGGDATTAVALGSVSLAHAAECVVRLLERLAITAPRARMREAMQGEALIALKSAVADLVADGPAPPARPAAEPVGIHPLWSGAAVGVGLPFGHSDADSLSRLVDVAQDSGASGFRTAPGRVLLIVNVPSRAASKLGAGAAALDFIVDAADPRRRVVACAGAPICASGQIATRALAPAVAEATRTWHDGIVHLSGCAKGCAHQGPARIGVFGRDGHCDVFADGAPSGSVAPDALPDRIARLAAMRGEAS